MGDSIATALLLAAALSAAVACQGPPADTSEDRGPIVARFGVQEITTADVDARILALPAGERPRPGEDLDAWYREQVRELAIERLLAAEAEAANLAEEEAFRASRREVEKQLAVQRCLAQLNQGLDEITEADLQAAYDQREDSLDAPERRMVFHIFRRRAPGARVEIEAIRDRVLAGESFLRLAEEFSESESRHIQGSLGWMAPGDLPQGFERVVFALEEGVPSEPVTTRDGFHVFYVDQILVARKLGFDEARPKLQQHLRAERRQAFLTELEASLEVPPDAIVLDREALARLQEAGDTEAVVLHLGDVELTLADLRRQLRQTLARSDTTQPIPRDLAWQVLDQLRRRELIFRHCEARDLIPRDQLAERLDAWQTQALISAQRQRRLLELAKRDQDRLRLFYDSNIGSFSQPPAWHVRLLSLPLGEDPARTMARLERAADGKDASLEALQTELGGEIEDLGFQTLNELGRRQLKLPPRIAPLESGQLAAPYRSGDVLEIAQVSARRPPQPLPFEEVEERVAAAYVEQYTRDLYETLSAELLADSELEILPEGLAALRQAGMSQPEVSVDELEALLDEM